MATIFIANIGLRDFQMEVEGDLFLPNGENVSQGKRDPEKLKEFLEGIWGEQPSQLGVKPLGQWLLERLKNQNASDKFFETVRCPILKPALDLVLHKTGSLDFVYLCGTDQEGAPQQFQVNDTYLTAQIIKEWLSRCYQGRLGNIQVLRLENVPIRWDEAYQLIADLNVPLGEAHVKLRVHLKDQEVYASLSGGIPALNFALHQIVLGVCGQKAHLIQVLEGGRGKSSEASFLNAWVFQGDRLIRQLQALLTNYNYKAAIELLESEICEDYQHSQDIGKVLAALRHADARLNFDFQRALEAIKDHQDTPFKAWYQSANHKTFADRVKEAIRCLKIFLQSHQLIAFVALADGILEGLTRLAAETLMPRLRDIYHSGSGDQIKSPLTPNLFVPCRSLAKVNKNLANYLKQQERDLQLHRVGPEKSWWSADEKFYDGVIKYFMEHGEEKEKRIANRFQGEKGQLRACLNRLRNDLLHDLANLSEEELLNKVQRHLQRGANLETLVNRLKGLLEQIVPNATKSVFDFSSVNRFVLETLSKVWQIPLPPS